MPSQIRVDNIIDFLGTGAPDLPYGATIPSGGTLTVNGNVNLAGVSTVGFLSATNGSVIGILTATSFVGDGSGLVGLQVVNPSKSIAFAIIQ
jgi:hypothetical protein